METQGGTMEVTIAIQPGPGVTGNVDATMASGKIENGKLDGDNISFEINTTYGTLAGGRR